MHEEIYGGEIIWHGIDARTDPVEHIGIGVGPALNMLAPVVTPRAVIVPKLKRKNNDSIGMISKKT